MEYIYLNVIYGRFIYVFFPSSVLNVIKTSLLQQLVLQWEEGKKSTAKKAKDQFFQT